MSKVEMSAFFVAFFAEVPLQYKTNSLDAWLLYSKRISGKILCRIKKMCL